MQGMGIWVPEINVGMREIWTEIRKMCGITLVIQGINVEN